MKESVRRIQKRRKFTEEFKRKIVFDFERGKYSVLDLCKLHTLSETQVYNWIYKYSTVNKKGYRVIEMKDSSDLKVKELEERIRELESVIGRKQIKIDFLEKMMDIAKEDLNIDIKKNYSTPQSSGSENIRNK